MTNGDKLEEISRQLKDGVKPQPVTARTFISWFDAKRRSTWNVDYIRGRLKDCDLITEPDFEFVYIDSEINIIRAPQNKKNEKTEELIHEAKDDPTYRIGKLASANHPPVSVKPDDNVFTATTLMITHDYSQLPIMTSNRDVKGVITWKSVTSQFTLGGGCNYVRDCIEPHKEISYDTYIFAAIDEIISNGYVLIRAANKVICGIVTTSDLSQQFRQLGEPFLLLGEIENYIRRMLLGKYTMAALQAACLPSERERKILRPSDLTLGEYIRLLEDQRNWEKLSINIDRQVFIEKLEEIRQIRNDVMHFDPDGIAEQDVNKLRDFVRLMQSLAHFGAI